MRRILTLLLMIMMVLTACGGNDDSASIDPVQLLTDSANKIRSSDTFRLYVLQQGAPYVFPIAVADGLMDVRFRLAEAQYVAPEVLYATASVVALGGVTIEVEIYAEGDNQWFRIPAMSMPWTNGEFAPGFNPATLIAEDSGFQAALTALIDLEFIGPETLEDGQAVYHLRGIADGEAVADLVVGLLDITGNVPVDVYINRETELPVRLILTQPETVSEEEPEPTQWVIDVYDINAEPDFEPPSTNDASGS